MKSVEGIMKECYFLFGSLFSKHDKIQPAS